MVVRLAVGPAVAFEEVARAQLLVAVRAREVLRVPGPAQRCDHLWEKRPPSVTEGFLRRAIDIPFSFTGVLCTCPTMGFSQALQHPFCGVCTPWRLMSARREPSMCSSSAGGGAGAGGAVLLR